MTTNPSPLDPIAHSASDILRQVFDQSTQGFQVIDRKWRYLFVNQAVASQGKSTPSQLIGRTMMDAYPGIDQTPLFTQLQRVMNDRVSIKMENEFSYPDGSTGWFQLFIHPWEEGIIIFSVDITARKLAEQELVNTIDKLSKQASPEILTQVTALQEAVIKLSQNNPTEI